MAPEIESEYIALARAVIIQAARDAWGGDRACGWLYKCVSSRRIRKQACGNRGGVKNA